MRSEPAAIFQQYFAELQRQAIPYVILHSYQKFPEEISSDVDYAVTDRDLARARGVIGMVAEERGWWIAQVFQHEISAFYTVLVNPREPSQFLKLDVCSHYRRNGCLFLRDEVLLAGRHSPRGFFVPAPAVEFAYVLVKALAKGKDPAEPRARLQQLWAMDPAGAQPQFAALAGPEAGAGADWLAAGSSEWGKLRRIIERRCRTAWSDRLAESRRRLRRVCQPAGLRLAILGPDGSGKTELISRLETRLAPCFRQQVVYHFRPMCGQRGAATVVAEPHRLPPRGRLASWAKVFYYFLDHWAGYLGQQLPALAHSRCVIFDRNFEDQLVDPRRYRLQGAAPLIRVLRRLLPPCALTFVLDADPVLVHQRKPELSLAELQRQRAALRSLAASQQGYVLVAATEPPAMVANTVGREIIRRLAMRLGARGLIADHGSPQGRDETWERLWTVAPSAAEAAVWRWQVVRRWGQPLMLLPSEPDLAAAALTLYPAQTAKARLGKQLLRGLLRARLPIWGFEKHSGSVSVRDPFLQFLGRLAGTAGGTLPKLAVLMGNPRLAGRRFVVLVFGPEREPVVVVKVGSSAAAARLIGHEEQLLSKVPTATPGVPRLRESYHQGAVQALVLDYVAGEPPRGHDPERLGAMLGAWVDTGRTITLGQTPAWQRLAGECAGFGLFAWLDRRLGGQTIHPALFHGDFVPWNIRVSPVDGSWTVLDWERGELGNPPGWDWFHYVVQTGVLLRAEPPRRLIRDLEQLLASAAFQAYAQVAGFAGRERELLLAYLLYCIEIIRPTESLRATTDLLHALTIRWTSD